MARAVSHADDAKVLHMHPNLSFSVGPYRYLIQSGGKHSLYTVTNGTQALSSPLLWAFGTPRVGQSYLFKKADGHFYEARVTYFETLKNLGFTPTRDLQSPKDVEEAMDRPVGSEEVSRCFGCHTTASTIGDKFDEENLILGVTCEACHGPAARHVAAMKDFMRGNLDAAKRGDIFNSAHLDPTDSVEFCGACHGTWWDVKNSGAKGVATTRSAPYRLVMSKCWGKGDARLTCIACHDPHEQLQTDSAAYDHACLKCHANSPGQKPTASHPGAACAVATKDCTRVICRRFMSRRCTATSPIIAFALRGQGNHFRNSPTSRFTLDYFHLPVPSTIVTYRSIGRSVNRSTAPPGCGQRTSSQSSLVRGPRPSTMRGS